MNELEPLSDDVQRFLDAERVLDAPAADARERMLTRLGPLLLVLPPAGGVPGADVASGATTTIAEAGFRAKILVPFVCAALGAAGGAATHAYVTRSPVPVPVKPSVELAVAPASVGAPVPSASAPASPAVSEETTPAGPSGSSGRAPPQPGATSSLRAERLLLESATAALMRGDGATAMETLKKHAREYPRGALAEEREVLWVKALRAQGNDEAAGRRANEFKRKFPSSLQQGAVEKPGGSP